MNRLIEKAKGSIRNWSSDEPRDLVLAVAGLCREILDDGGLPEGDEAWERLRHSFDVTKEQSVASTITDWDDQCRLGDFDLSDDDAYVKLGIVTWTVKLLARKLHMLKGPAAPDIDLEEWKSHLVACLDRYIIVK